MKIIPQIIAFVAFLAVTGAAFAPVSWTTSHNRAGARRQETTTTTVVVTYMGLFDNFKEYFSEEAKAKREAEKQRMIEEQEEAYREVLARRRNPEKMEEYMDERKERLSKYMGGSDNKDE